MGGRQGINFSSMAGAASGVLMGVACLPGDPLNKPERLNSKTGVCGGNFDAIFK
jgi:hypothetical protein